MAPGAAATDHSLNLVSNIIAAIIFMAMYWLPTIIAVARRRPVGGIAVLNTLLGWTILGWIISLVWAASRPAQPQTIIIQAPAAVPQPGSDPRAP